MWEISHWLVNTFLREKKNISILNFIRVSLHGDVDEFESPRSVCSELLIRHVEEEVENYESRLSKNFLNLQFDLL